MIFFICVGFGLNNLLSLYTSSIRELWLAFFLDFIILTTDAFILLLRSVSISFSVSVDSLSLYTLVVLPFFDQSILLYWDVNSRLILIIELYSNSDLSPSFKSTSNSNKEVKALYKGLSLIVYEDTFLESIISSLIWDID